MTLIVVVVVVDMVVVVVVVFVVVDDVVVVVLAVVYVVVAVRGVAGSCIGGSSTSKVTVSSHVRYVQRLCDKPCVALHSR